MSTQQHTRDLVLDGPHLLALLRDDLPRVGRLTLRVSGDSMWPAIPDGAVVTLEPIAAGTLTAGQVVCFAEGERVRLHRIVEFDAEGHAIVRGDNLQHSDGVVARAQLYARVVDAPPRLRPGFARRMRRWIRRRLSGLGGPPTATARTPDCCGN